MKQQQYTCSNGVLNLIALTKIEHSAASMCYYNVISTDYIHHTRTTLRIGMIKPKSITFPRFYMKANEWLFSERLLYETSVISRLHHYANSLNNPFVLTSYVTVGYLSIIELKQ